MPPHRNLSDTKTCCQFGQLVSKVGGQTGHAGFETENGRCFQDKVRVIGHLIAFLSKRAQKTVSILKQPGFHIHTYRLAVRGL